MGFSRGFSLCVVLFFSGWISETIGRAIPNPVADLPASGMSKRAVASSEFATMYDLYDRINPPSPKGVPFNDDSLPRLKPIGVVLMTMHATSQTATPAVVPDQPLATPSPVLALQSSPTTPHAATPYPFNFGGPGPALLPSSVYKSLISSNPGVNDISPGNNSSTPIAPSKHLTVLGIVIGALLFFTLCVFILMSPPDTLAGCAMFKRAPRKDDRLSKEAVQDSEKPFPDSSSWMTISSPSTTVKRPSLDLVKGGRKSGERVRDTVIDVVAALSCSDSNDYPTSKFSICSSEYPPSSTCTGDTDLASNSSTVKVLSPAAKHLSVLGKAVKPIRPPRPPTADSPVLSDSVYLACRDASRPYVIVAPQPLTADDFYPESFRPQPPRKFLTSTEFVALHLRITGGHLPPGTKRSSQDSRHSRTKSAPALGRRNRTSCFSNNINIPPSKSLVSEKLDTTSTKTLNRTSLKCDDKGLIEDIDGDSDVQESMVRRVTKHRRSRSASGWAYPSKGQRTRRTFKLEEE